MKKLFIPLVFCITLLLVACVSMPKGILRQMNESDWRSQKMGEPFSLERVEESFNLLYSYEFPDTFTSGEVWMEPLEYGKPVVVGGTLASTIVNDIKDANEGYIAAQMTGMEHPEFSLSISIQGSRGGHGGGFSEEMPWKDKTFEMSGISILSSDLELTFGKEQLIGIFYLSKEENDDTNQYSIGDILDDLSLIDEMPYAVLVKCQFEQ